MIGRLFANLSFTSMYRMSVISATKVYFCTETKEIQSRLFTHMLINVCDVWRHLAVPDGVGGVCDDG